MEVTISSHVSIETTLRIRQLFTVSGVSHTSIRTILISHKFRPYKIHVEQEFNEDDFDRRVEFNEHRG